MFDLSLIKELKSLGFSAKTEKDDELYPTVFQKRLGNHNKFIIKVDGAIVGEIPTPDRWCLSLIFNTDYVYNRWSRANFETPKQAYDYAVGLVEVITNYENRTKTER